MPDPIPPRLGEIISEFQFCEGQEKLELLIQYAQSLPPLPAQLAEQRESMQPIPECLTPVFMEAEAHAGKFYFHFDVPPESPMVRGFAAVMKQGLDGSTAEDILKVPVDFFQEMGLDKVLSHQRLNGLTAILVHMKQHVVQALDSGSIPRS